MFESITKKELIRALDRIPNDAVVAFASNYGDRGQTKQAHALRGQVQQETVGESAYADSGYALRNWADPTEEGETRVWIIS